LLAVYFPFNSTDKATARKTNTWAFTATYYETFPPTNSTALWATLSNSDDATLDTA
jgi:hypothetical protein